MKIELESLRELGGAESFLERFESAVPSEVTAKIGSTYESGVGFPTLLGEVLSAFTDGKGAFASFFLFVLGAVMLMSLCSYSSERMGKWGECAVGVIVSASVFARLYPAVASVNDALDGVMSFCTAFIPVLTAALSYGGSAASAAVGAMGASMTLGIIGAFVIPLLSGCVPLFFALGLISGVGDNGVSGLLLRIRNFFMWAVGIASTLLLSSIALQSVIASSSDSAAMRAAKYAASGAIPIVGGSVSAALGAVSSGVACIKSIIGAGAITVILMMVLSPLAALLAYRFILSFAEGLLDFLGVQYGVRLFSSFRFALDTLISVFALCVCVLITETAILMKSGAGAV